MRSGPACAATRCVRNRLSERIARGSEVAARAMQCEPRTMAAALCVAMYFLWEWVVTEAGTWQTDWAVEVQLAFDRHILNGMQLRSKSPVFEGWGTRLDVEREIFQLKILREHLQPCPSCLPCDSAGLCSASWCVRRRSHICGK